MVDLRFKLISVLVATVLALTGALMNSSGNLQSVLVIEGGFACEGEMITTNITAHNVSDLANFDTTIYFDPDVVKVLDADNNPAFGIEVNNLNYSDNCIRIASINTEDGFNGDVWLSKLKLKAVGNPGDCSELIPIPNTVVDSSEVDIPLKIQKGTFCISMICENEVYFKPEVSKARLCETTDVEIWINGSNFQGGQINLTYDSSCAEIVNWVRDTTNFPYGGWNSRNNGTEWITFANETILIGEYKVGTLTIHCIDDDCQCSTGLHFDESDAINYSAIFNNLGNEIPAKWKDGKFECWCGICGDVNCDDKVNMGDVILLLNHVTYGYPLCNEWAGDVNCDGKINMGDVILLLNHVTYGYSLNCCPECVNLNYV